MGIYIIFSSAGGRGDDKKKKKKRERERGRLRTKENWIVIGLHRHYFRRGLCGWQKAYEGDVGGKSTRRRERENSMERKKERKRESRNRMEYVGACGWGGKWERKGKKIIMRRCSEFFERRAKKGRGEGKFFFFFFFFSRGR